MIIDTSAIIAILRDVPEARHHRMQEVDIIAAAPIDAFRWLDRKADALYSS